MANKRTLKRDIHLISEELFAEAVAMQLYGPDGSKENAEALLFSIIKMEDEYIRRASHPEPGMLAAKYFKDLRDNFNAQVSEIVDQLNG